MEVEITEIPPLNTFEQSLMDMHSVLNILTVLHLQLSTLGVTLGRDPDLLKSGLHACTDAKGSLGNHESSMRFVERVPGHVMAILAEIDHAVERCAADRREPRLAAAIDNIGHILQVLRIRAAELILRSRTPDRRGTVAIDELRTDMQTSLSAIEKNSDGRYRIFCNVARQRPTDYVIDFEAASVRGPTVLIPLVFRDVMRDLIANARKYTPPGGLIVAGLYESANELRFVVQDTGYGIPPGEITDVVRFGYRGSNVSHLRTMGGGFGLTKAYSVTKQFGGRFWIKSDLGVGTRISISIPQPAAA